MLRIEKKLRTDKGIGVVEALIIFMVLAAFLMLMISWHNDEREQEEAINTEYLHPTAGIVYYMSRLEYHCMQNAEPIEFQESEVKTVSAHEEEDVVEYGLYNLTDHELLARIIYCECGNLGEEAMYAAGSVVINRMNHHMFADTIKGVIFQQGQYAPTWDGNWEQYSEPPDICWEIAEDLLVNGSTIPKNVVFQAQFEQGDGCWKQIDNQYFCYLN